MFVGSLIKFDKFQNQTNSTPQLSHPTQLALATGCRQVALYMPNTMTNPKITYSRCKRHTLTLLSPYIVFSSLP